MFKDFKEKFISYLNKVHVCPYCNGIKKNIKINKLTFFETYKLTFFLKNNKILYIRGCRCRKPNNKLINSPKPLHPDYKIFKRYYEVQFKCKCRKNRHFFSNE